MDIPSSMMTPGAGNERARTGLGSPLKFAIDGVPIIMYLDNQGLTHIERDYRVEVVTENRSGEGRGTRFEDTEDAPPDEPRAFLMVLRRACLLLSDYGESKLTTIVRSWPH
jgi:hypothetical protein